MKKTNIARLAVTAGLTLAMGAGMMAPATVAFAADATTTGNITINKVDGNDTTFTGYQIFTGKVEEVNGQKKVSDLDWANKDVKAAVESVSKKTFNTAQDGADWITQQITGTDSTTAVEANSTANALAKAVSGVTKTTTVKPDTATNLSAGYWLFVTTASTVGDNEAATAPIFAVVGGSAVKVTEKDSVPTVTKKLANGDTSGSTGVGKVLSYEVDGTISSDVATFSTYKYVFTDTLSNGLDYVDGSVKVTVDGKDVTDHVTTKTYADHVLTVGFDNLKAVTGLTKDSKVVVTYQAKVNSHAIAGTGSNLDNHVKLEYSNNPHTTDTGKITTVPPVKEYTYQLKLVKRDRDTEKALDGASFTIKNSDGKYVQSDGSLGDSVYTFTANGDNGFTVNGLDAGTYTVDETVAPDGYQKTGEFTFTITPTISTSGDNKGALTDLGLTVANNSDVIAGTPDGTKGDHQLQPKADTATDVANGTVTVTVGDKQEITMPLTGMKGTTALMVYGSAILVISAAAYLKHKRNASNDDAE